MPTINALNTVSATNFNTRTNAPSLRVAGPAEQLAAIDAKYPNLEADLAQAREDVISTEGSDTWAGLKWYEKAVFFILPIGPLLGVVMMSQNKDMHRNAVNNLDKLENIATARDYLAAEVAATRLDRIG
ncbi:MAG: hypothetical protein VX834_04510 [Myxococcota bacterium]|nr:hypothetical protein [Myxococcota bacterium]